MMGCSKTDLALTTTTTTTRTTTIIDNNKSLTILVIRDEDDSFPRLPEYRHDGLLQDDSRLLHALKLFVGANAERASLRCLPLQELDHLMGHGTRGGGGGEDTMEHFIDRLMREKGQGLFVHQLSFQSVTTICFCLALL